MLETLVHYHHNYLLNPEHPAVFELTATVKIGTYSLINCEITLSIQKCFTICINNPVQCHTSLLTLYLG